MSRNAISLAKASMTTTLYLLAHWNVKGELASASNKPPWSRREPANPDSGPSGDGDPPPIEGKQGHCPLMAEAGRPDGFC
jgi:hypothetical protein